jgi:ketosteroid isomerase-like protein
MTELTGNAGKVAAVYEAMAAADLEGVLALCAPELTITQTEALPWGGRYSGRDGVIEFVTKLITTIESTVTHDEIFEAGDRVVQRGRTAGTVRATGVEFDVPEVHVWTLKDGKLVAAEFYIDTPAMLAALG